MNKNIYEGIKLIRQPKQLAAENDRYIRSVLNNNINFLSNGIDDIIINNDITTCVHSIYLNSENQIICVTNMGEVNYNSLDEMDKVNICCAIEKNKSILLS